MAFEAVTTPGPVDSHPALATAAARTSAAVVTCLRAPTPYPPDEQREKHRTAGPQRLPARRRSGLLLLRGRIRLILARLHQVALELIRHPRNRRHLRQVGRHLGV